jgi:hypothetical protein
MAGLKFITMIFPFIREMILGEKTLLEALKTNKLKVLLLAAIMASFALNVMAIPKLISISDHYVRLRDRAMQMEKINAQLQSDKDSLSAQYRACQKVPPVPVSTAAVPAPVGPAVEEPSPLPAPVPSVPVPALPPVPVLDSQTQRGYDGIQKRYKQATRAPIKHAAHPPANADGDDHWKRDFDQIQSQENQLNHSSYNH